MNIPLPLDLDATQVTAITTIAPVTPYTHYGLHSSYGGMINAPISQPQPEREQIITEHFTTFAENPKDGFNVDLTAQELDNLPVEALARFVRSEKLVGDRYSVRFNRDDRLPNEQALKALLKEGK